MVDLTHGRLPFQEAIDFISQKVRLPSKAWTDLKEGAHARAFVVAGAMKDHLVAVFHAAITSAIAEGKTKDQFLADFDAIVAKHGWDYNGGRKWRSAVIYNTNMRMATAAGRWSQITALAGQLEKKGRRLYLRYVAILDGATRPMHREWGTQDDHGIILPYNDPWWDTHFPPNDWGCRCTVQTMTDDDLKERGWSVTSQDNLPVQLEDRNVNTSMGTENWPTPEGVGTGFGYNVGKSWLQGAVPAPMQTSLPAVDQESSVSPMPALIPHQVPSDRILPAGLPDQTYIEKFLAEFGATMDQPAAFRDVSGTLMGIGKELFQTKYGDLKVQKNGREIAMLLLADALKDPDEIWLDWVTDGTGLSLRRRYLKAQTVDKISGQFPGAAGMLSVFEWSRPGWWAGVTTFPPERDANFSKQRKGVLIWKRPGAEVAS